MKVHTYYFHSISRTSTKYEKFNLKNILRLLSSLEMTEKRKMYVILTIILFKGAETNCSSDSTVFILLIWPFFTTILLTKHTRIIVKLTLLWTVLKSIDISYLHFKIE